MQISRHVLLYAELVECSDVTYIDSLGKIYSLLKTMEIMRGSWKLGSIISALD
jgi:hypothetical protein